MPFAKVLLNICMTRPVCKVCNQRYAAVNYRKENITHYRSKCDSCARKHRKIKPAIPKWKTAGYSKKLVCDRCSFRARYSAQTLVYHLDGNLKNCNLNNLKSVCLNCSIEVIKLDLPWQVGDLSED